MSTTAAGSVSFVSNTARPYFKVAHDTGNAVWVRAGDYGSAPSYRVHVYLRPTGVEVTVSEVRSNVVNATANESPPSDAAITGPQRP